MNTATQNLDDLNQKVGNTLKWVSWSSKLVVVLTVIVGAWLVTEPDPLVVGYTTQGDTSTTTGRKYPLARKVTSDADLVINVKEYWSREDGPMIVNGVEYLQGAEYPHKPLSVYTLVAGTKDKEYVFPKAVPADLGIGVYIYRPQAEYKVNFFKSKVKDLPIQRVVVTEDYDVNKHGVME